MSNKTTLSTDTTPASIDDPLALSKQRLAREFGCSRETVARLLDAARIDPCGERGGYPVYRLGDVAGVLADYQRFGRHPGETLDPAHMTPKERLDWFNSERARMAVAREAGELVEAQAVREYLAGLFDRTRHEILVVPDKLERDGLLTGPGVERVADYMATLLEEIVAVAIPMPADNDRAA